MRIVSLLSIVTFLGAASIPVHGEELVVTIGKQLAARSAIEWNVYEIDHRLLGPIRYAVQKNAVTTTVQDGKIVSLAFVSCQKSTRKIAIELTNASELDLAGGLRPMEAPRLVCSRPDPGGGSALVKSELAATWKIGLLGDTLARDLSPTELRQCVSIEVLQSIAPPKGAAQGSQHVAMEITPYSRALDSVFTACGETSAVSPAERSAPASPPAVEPGPRPGGAPGAQSDEAPWRRARTITKRRTNVREATGLDSPIVIKLDPGTKILAQQTSVPLWWKVKARNGAGFRGYVRVDRLVFE